MDEKELTAARGEEKILQGKASAWECPADDEWLGPEPAIGPARETVSADVIVVGAGIAGICAARAAAEEGASVVILEKCTHFNARSGQYGVIGGHINEIFGRPAVDPDAVTDSIMAESGYHVRRANISRWARQAHRVFDWYIGVMPDLYIAKRSDEKIPPDRRFYLAPLSWPLPAAYDYRHEKWPVYPTSMTFVPGHAPLVKANLKKAEELGAKVYYAYAAERLDTADGRVCGVTARDMKNGGYVRFAARRGVILATGDNAGDPAILRRFLPQVLQNGVPLSPLRTTDADGRLINTGDGLRLGVRAGAAVQQYHAVSAHNMGIFCYSLGVTPFLYLNRAGRRFMNENVPGQQVQNQLELQPGHILHQIFDSRWREQLPFMPPNHGAVCGWSGDEINEDVEDIMSEACFEESLKRGTIVSADTLEELLEQLDIDKEAALRSIERYNELARAGCDMDFGKTASRLFPVEKGPFYASTFGLSPMLCAMGGLESDEECRVYTPAGEVLPGLYAAGNVQGDIYAGAYPSCVRGMSHSVCMFYGYVAGKNAAGADSSACMG